jgi:iron complex outermembrane receptor protein
MVLARASHRPGVRDFSLTVTLLVAVAFSHRPVSAQAPTMEPQPMALDPVVVTATRAARAGLDVPASVDVVEADAIRDAQLRVNLSESLARVPGVVVLNRQNYAQDLQISIRGFGARASFGVRGVRLYVDGVPASSPDGQGQVSHFPLGSAERIEVLRGPFSALYGNSSGGVIALTTALRAQPFQAELAGAAGSFGTWRAGLSAAGGQDANAFALEAGRFETAGERKHSAARRDLLSLRTAFDDTPLGRLRLSINSLAMPDAQDPLGLTRAQFGADPTQAAPVALQFNTRKTTRQTTLGAQLASTMTEAVTLYTTAWTGTRAVAQFQAIPVATQSTPTHPGGVIDFDRRFAGADLRLSLEAAPFVHALGVTGESLLEARRGFENFVGAGPTQTLGVPGALRRDERNRLRGADAYLQSEWRQGPWRVYAGARRATLSVRSDDRFISAANGDDSGRTRFVGTAPTAGVAWRPVDALALYAAFGRGFETPTLNELAYRADGSAGLNTDLRPARSRNLELGIKALRSSTVRATLAVFDTRTDDDIVVRSNLAGRASFANAAQTRRRGAETSVTWRPVPATTVTAAASALRAEYASGFLTCGPPPCAAPTVAVASGSALPGVPRYSGFLEWRQVTGRADITAAWRGQSALPVDDRGSDRAAGYGVVAFSASRTIELSGFRPRVFVRVDNMLDRRYGGSVIVNEANGRWFEPAPGRAWSVGLDWPLQP